MNKHLVLIAGVFSLGMMLLCGVLFTSNLVMAQNPVTVTDFTITQPANVPSVSTQTYNVTGTIKAPDEFSTRYAICLYKLVSGHYYWQQNAGNVTVIGSTWQGQIWLQNTGFSQPESQAGFKMESVVAIVCEQSNLPNLPGHGRPSAPLTQADVDAALARGIGINKTFPADFKNILPSLPSPGGN